MNEKYTATRVTDAQRASLLEQALSSVSPLLKAWVAPEELERALTADLDAQLEMTRDLGFAARFYDQCKVPDTEPADYLQRLLLLSDGHCALVGIRFKGMDLSLPFVDLVAHSFPLSDGASLAAAISAIEDAFAVFAPKWIRLMCWQGTEVAWPEGVRLSPDLCYLAAPVSEIQRLPLPRGSERLALTRCEDTTFYPRYRAVHDDFRVSSSLGAEVSPSSEADLKECINTGAVFEAYAGRRWAGLIAAARHAERGLSGYCVYEEILDSDHRGQGLAAPMQRKMIDTFAGGHGVLIFGTIHHNNKPSLATARRVGRKEVCRYIFVHLSEGS